MKKLLLPFLIMLLWSKMSFAQSEPTFNQKTFHEFFFNYFSEQFINPVVFSNKKIHFCFLLNDGNISVLADSIPSELKSYFEVFNLNSRKYFTQLDSGTYIYPISFSFVYKENTEICENIYLKDLNKFISNFQAINGFYKVYNPYIFTLQYIPKGQH